MSLVTFEITTKLQDREDRGMNSLPVFPKIARGSRTLTMPRAPSQGEHVQFGDFRPMVSTVTHVVEEGEVTGFVVGLGPTIFHNHEDRFDGMVETMRKAGFDVTIVEPVPGT